MSDQEDSTRKQYKVKCCDCSGEVTFVEPRPQDQPVFYHTLPYCKRFERTETADQLADYVRDCRIKVTAN